MNDQEFEQLIRAARPAQPTADLEKRIAADFAQQPTRTSGVVAKPSRGVFARWIANLGWAATGAAAAVAAMSAFQKTPPHPAPQPAVAHHQPAQPTTIAIAAAPVTSATTAPVQTSEEFLEANDEGVAVDQNGPSRIVRLTSIERRSWVDEGGAEMFVEVPRQEIVRVPVSIQ